MSVIRNRVKELRYVPAKELRRHERNWRKHPKAQRQALEAVLGEIGFAGAVLAREGDDGTLHLIDGHLRADLLDSQAVPVLVTDLSEDEALAVLGTYDGIGALAVADADVFAGVLDDVRGTFEGMGDVLSEMAQAFDVPLPTDEPPEPREDQAETLQKKWGVQRGDLWAIGEHRLLCGDSTDADDVARLMGGEKADVVLTDPPYGVSYADKNRFFNMVTSGSRIQEPIANDHLSVNEMGSLWLGAFSCALKVSADHASYYITSPQGGELMMMMMMIRDAGWQLKHSIIWVKNHHVLGRSDYNYKHEPILYGWNKRHRFYGKGQFKTSVWTIDKPLRSKIHPTTKPVELFIEFLLNSSDTQDIAYDPFGGSGTTMVACEQLGRRCRMIEIEPRYCSVILERMSEMGLEPERVG